MKKILLLSVCLLSFLFLSGCPGGGNNACSDPVSLEKVYPFSTTPDAPVLIKGVGFNSNTVVRFGNVKASVLDVSENYISTKVPHGLLGKIELSLVNSVNCILVTDFEVTTGSSAISPASPSTYSIPEAGSAFLPQIGLDASIHLHNIHDNKNFILILVRGENGVSSDGYESTEGTYWEDPWHPIAVDLNLNENRVSLSIDRSASSLPDEHLEGKFYNLTLPVNGQPVTGNFLIAFSTITGHQYIFKAN